MWPSFTRRYTARTSLTSRSFQELLLIFMGRFPKYFPFCSRNALSMSILSNSSIHVTHTRTSTQESVGDEEGRGEMGDKPAMLVGKSAPMTMIAPMPKIALTVMMVLVRKKYPGRDGKMPITPTLTIQFTLNQAIPIGTFNSGQPCPNSHLKQKHIVPESGISGVCHPPRHRLFTRDPMNLSTMLRRRV